jgi:hypothetical protein
MNPESMKFHYAQQDWSYASFARIWVQPYSLIYEGMPLEMMPAVGLKHGSYLQLFADVPPANYAEYYSDSQHCMNHIMKKLLYEGSVN